MLLLLLLMLLLMHLLRWLLSKLLPAAAHLAPSVACGPAAGGLSLLGRRWARGRPRRHGTRRRRRSCRCCRAECRPSGLVGWRGSL
jgi:hypothetical protein